MRFRVERFAKQDRSSFDCGNDELNRYLKHTAGQDQRRRYAVCFLAIENETEALAGYYSLSSGSVDLDRIPEGIAKRLPRYPAVPIVQIGRLAVDVGFQKTGLARWLLANAYKRVQNQDIGAFALAVDAIDENAEGFYLHYGFQKLESHDGSVRMLFLPIGNERS